MLKNPQFRQEHTRNTMLWQARVSHVELGTFLQAYATISPSRPPNRNGYLLPNLTRSRATNWKEKLCQERPTAFLGIMTAGNTGERFCEDSVSAGSQWTSVLKLCMLMENRSTLPHLCQRGTMKTYRWRGSFKLRSVPFTVHSEKLAAIQSNVIEASP